jgi:hypothetical protein
VIGLVAEENLAILETNTRSAQPVPIRVLEVMNPDGSQSCRACPSKLIRISLSGSTTRGAPRSVLA